jgi:hypothetical protein
VPELKGGCDVLFGQAHGQHSQSFPPDEHSLSEVQHRHWAEAGVELPTKITSDSNTYREGLIRKGDMGTLHFYAPFGNNTTDFKCRTADCSVTGRREVLTMTRLDA